jgi:hypothetical protein
MLLWTTSTNGPSAAIEIGVKSLKGSNGTCAIVCGTCAIAEDGV